MSALHAAIERAINQDQGIAMNQYELIGVALARALSGIASEQQLSAAIEAFANLEKKFTKPDGFQTRRKGTSDWGGVITHRPPDSYELRECEIRNIYIAPPPAPPIPNVAAAPHPQVEVTDEMCARAALYDTETESALLGPALGMTAWRKPTDAELRRDAERYRWLRDKGGLDIDAPWCVFQGKDWHGRNELDAAIDAARGGE